LVFLLQKLKFSELWSERYHLGINEECIANDRGLTLLEERERIAADGTSYVINSIINAYNLFGEFWTIFQISLQLLFGKHYIVGVRADLSRFQQHLLHKECFI
jgi:hypothetical protein